MNKLFLQLFILLILFANGCKPSNERNFKKLTSSIYLLEESNYADFRSFIVDAHVQFSDLSAEVIHIYDIIDTVRSKLLVASGGYNKDGSMIGGDKKKMGKIIINQFELFKKIKSRMKILKKDYSKMDKFDRLLIDDLEKALYIILHNKLNLDDTVAKLYLDLIIVQNRLLVADVTHFELKYHFNELYGKNP